MPVDDVHAGERHARWLRRRLSPSLPCSLREARRRSSPPCVCWQRFWGFGICCALGFLLSFGVRPPARRPALALALAAVRRPPLSADVDARVPQSIFRFTELLAGRPRDFALMYACGNIVSLAGTSFIVGPCRQLKNMFKKNRWVATVIYFASIGVTVSRHKRLLLLHFFPAQPVAMARARRYLLAWMKTSKTPRGGRW